MLKSIARDESALAEASRCRKAQNGERQFFERAATTGTASNEAVTRRFECRVDVSTHY